MLSVWYGRRKMYTRPLKIKWMYITVQTKPFMRWLGSIAGSNRYANSLLTRSVSRSTAICTESGRAALPSGGSVGPGVLKICTSSLWPGYTVAITPVERSIVVQILLIRDCVVRFTQLIIYTEKLYRITIGGVSLYRQEQDEGNGLGKVLFCGGWSVSGIHGLY